MTFCILSSCLTQTINNLIYFKSLSFFTSAKTSGQEPSVNLGSQCASVVACEQIMIMTEYSGGHSYIALFLSATSFSWVASGIFSHRKKIWWASDCQSSASYLITCWGFLWSKWPFLYSPTFGEYDAYLETFWNPWLRSTWRYWWTVREG